MQSEEQKQMLQWHPAFFADIQIEFCEEAEKLIFENEHQLGTRPKEIDVLIIKKEGTEPVRKNIGRIFRKHNIVEYKAPGDYFSVDDYYKVYGYACFYKSDTGAADQIDIREITITLVSHGYPRTLIRHLEEVRGFHLEKADEGIYYVKGDFVPIQIIVTRWLDREKNLWLKSLTNALESQREANEILEEYAGHQDEELYASVMHVIAKANAERFGGEEMCEALEEIIEPRIRKRVEEGKAEGMSEGKASQLIEMGQEFGLSEENILDRLQNKLGLSLQKAQEYMVMFGKTSPK